MGLLKDYSPVFEKAHQFVSSQGKTENLQFIYRALVDSDKVNDAKKWLDENRHFYHKAALAKIEKMVQGKLD